MNRIIGLTVVALLWPATLMYAIRKCDLENQAFDTESHGIPYPASVL